MKQTILFLSLCMCVVFSASAQGAQPARRALFVSVVQTPQTLSHRAEIDKLIEFSKKAGIKILFVQIYRANQAWFPSKIADDRPYANCFKNLSEDPLALLIKKAHRQGIEVHAWLNVLSLGANQDAWILKKYGTDILTRNLQKKQKLEDYKIDSQYFLEPGDPRVQGDLLKIVEEVLRAYPDLDGIQFDYIRYPDPKPHYGYTKINVEQFKKATGLSTIDDNSLIWKDWKRRQVTDFLKRLVKRARTIRPRIQVSATGCMPYIRAREEAFQDWPAWLDHGLVDFVTIMNYSPDPAEFERWIKTAQTKTKNFDKVKIGVGAYKLTATPKLFEQEFKACEKTGNACAVFHYASVLENPRLGRFLTSAPQ